MRSLDPFAEGSVAGAITSKPSKTFRQKYGAFLAITLVILSIGSISWALARVNAGFPEGRTAVEQAYSPQDQPAPVNPEIVQRNTGATAAFKRLYGDRVAMGGLIAAGPGMEDLTIVSFEAHFWAARCSAPLHYSATGVLLVRLDETKCDNIKAQEYIRANGI